MQKPGTGLKYSSMCHSKIYEQTKVVNHSLGNNMLRCLVRNHVKVWKPIIPQAEFTYDTSINGPMKKTSFEVACGLKPQHVLDLVPLPQETKPSKDKDTFAEHIRQIHEEVWAVIPASNELYALEANLH